MSSFTSAFEKKSRRLYRQSLLTSTNTFFRHTFCVPLCDHCSSFLRWHRISISNTSSVIQDFSKAKFVVLKGTYRHSFEIGNKKHIFGNHFLPLQNFKRTRKFVNFRSSQDREACLCWYLTPYSQWEHKGALNLDKPIDGRHKYSYPLTHFAVTWESPRPFYVIYDVGNCSWICWSMSLT